MRDDGVCSVVEDGAACAVSELSHDPELHLDDGLYEALERGGSANFYFELGVITFHAIVGEFAVCEE